MNEFLEIIAISPESGCTFVFPSGIILGMNEQIYILSERVDDIPVLIELMKAMTLPQILDHCLAEHGNHTGISNGMMATVWLAFILSQGDHRKEQVRTWVSTRKNLLEKLLPITISETDFTDDRLGILLKYLSDTHSWCEIEAALWQKSLRIIPPNNGIPAVRVDATTVSGYHTIIDEGIMQLGNSKAHRPDLGQFKLMSASHQPSGCLIATDIHSGESADDPLYVPIIKRVQDILQMSGILYVGDCKMSSLETRGYIAESGNLYLGPFPFTGKMRQLSEELIDFALANPGMVSEFASEGLDGRGFERVREVTTEIEGEKFCWEERLLIVQFSDLARRQAKDLDERLKLAEKLLLKLTDKPGRGKRVFRTEKELENAVSKILKENSVEGLLDVKIEKCETRQTKFIGKGRGSDSRPTREVISKRVVIGEVQPLRDAINRYKARLGWRIYGTNASSAYLSLEKAMLEYRKGWCLERSFHLLKDQPIGISPLYVQTDVQIKGLTNLLLLANRLLSEIELRVRASLKANNEKLEGLKAGSPKQETATPTAVKILCGISRSEITLTKITTKAGTSFQLSVIPGFVFKILKHLGLNPSVYESLAEIEVSTKKIRER